ncbi:MAG: 3'-5' exonuclease [Aquificaceae bacterium]
MKLLFLDFETTGLDPKRDLVWQAVYARALRKGDRLNLIEVAELVGKDCLLELQKALSWAEVLVAHNLFFEKRFLRSKGFELPRRSYCTMIQATPVCREHLTYGYKLRSLSEAVEILKLEDELKSIITGTYHDALYDIFATLLLYARLEGLRLDRSGYRLRRANRFRKYLTARRYAWEGYREDILEELSNDLFLKPLHWAFKISESIKRLTAKVRWKIHRIRWRKYYEEY